MEKLDARKLSREELFAKRKEVIHLHKKRTPVMKIVEECGLSWPAVNVTIRLYEAGGVQALEPAQRGKKQGTGRILSEEQEDELRTILYRKRPWKARLKQHKRYTKFSLWDRDTVQQLIYQQCGTMLSLRGVAKYLQRWGFPLIKQNKQPIKGCTRAIQCWLKRNYESLDQLYKSGTAEIYWVSRKPFVNCKTVNARGKKTLSMISAIDNHGKEHWLVVTGKFTQEKQISFLKALAHSSRGQVIVIREDEKHFADMEWVSENNIKIKSYPPLLPNELKNKENELKRAAVVKEELKIEREQRRISRERR